MAKTVKKRRQNKSKLIEAVYSSPKSSAAFRGVQAVWKALKDKNLKIGKKEVEEWLMKNDSFTLHRPVRYHFKRRPIEVRGLGCIYEIDLMDLPPLARANDNHRYLLNVIDCFSKKAYVRKLKTKSGEEVTAAMKDILQAAPKPLFIRSDSGKEFINSKFQKLMKDYNIAFYTSRNETKCAMIERFNSTLGTAIGRYLTHNDTKRYIDVLSSLVSSYNNTYHSVIKMKPNQVCKRNERKVFMNIYSKKVKKIKRARFKVGDIVRISKSKQLFKKNYNKSWSVEVFKVVKVHDTSPRVYELSDMSGEKLIGTFYTEEMTRVLDHQLVEVEKILKHKNQGGKQLIYVKWKDYDSSHNSWIPSDTLQQI
jgi:transposase InsO family protein